MKLVIDIPEDIYTRLFDNGIEISLEDREVINTAIRHGTSLSEVYKWIPVSERLPEKSGNYWCTFGGTNIARIDYYTTESDAKEFFEDPERYIGWLSRNVIAWTPLPEPYKTDKKESENEKSGN